MRRNLYNLFPKINLFVTPRWLYLVMKMIFLTLLSLTTVMAQVFTFEREITGYGNATSIAPTVYNSIVVSEESTGLVYILDFEGNKIKTIGGLGWDNYSFWQISDITTTQLNVYIADKGNDRIQVYDRNLNYIYSITPSSPGIKEPFEKPSGVAVTSAGEILILDSGSNSILKLDSKASHLLSFGGVHSGEFRLTDASSIDIVNGIFVSAGDRNILNLFDKFGTGLLKLKLPFVIKKLASVQNILLVSGVNNILAFRLTDNNLINHKFELTGKIPEGDILDIGILENRLLILTSKSIFIYKSL